MAEFEVQFNVATSDYQSYQTTIVGLRRRLGEISNRYSHGRPVLPVQENPPRRWFDIVMRQTAQSTQSVRLRFRMGNLYLDGYQMANGQWWEFNNTTGTPLIPGSNFLGFDGSYNDLANAAGQMMVNVSLGQQPLLNAVNQLATTPDRQLRARSLIVVIQMICESSRFMPISDRLTRTYRDGSLVASWMLDLERSWGDFSEVLLRADAYPEQSFTLPPNNIRIPIDPTSNDTSVDSKIYRITTLPEAANVLGILLGLIFRRSALSASMAVNDLGRPLVEVFSVKINHIDRENPGNLYGTITVTDGLDLQYIYNRGKENPESIKPGDNALLTGPARSISAYGNFTIKVLLTDEDSEVSSGEIWWNAYNTTNEFDKPLFRNIDGKNGSVTVNYIVLRDAVAASVQVTLIKRNGENPADVYGQLTATNGNFGDSKSVLFQKASDENINVSPGQLIPLSRSTVAVPLNSSLVVRASLYDFDAEIANGTAEFPAQLSGTVEKSIFGKDGEIRVKVTWILYN